MSISQGDIPQTILADSLLARLAAAHSAVANRLERKSGCSATRGYILSTLRGNVELNQNQIATLLGFDRTVVHRSIRAMVQEGLVSEKKASTGRAIHLRLTPRGQRYRERLIEARKAADQTLREQMSEDERREFARLLKLVAELEF